MEFLKITKNKRDSMAIYSPESMITEDNLFFKTVETIKYVGKVIDYCCQTCKLGMKAMVCSFGDGYKNRSSKKRSKLTISVKKES